MGSYALAREDVRWQAFALLGFLVLVAMAASIGSAATYASIEPWYDKIAKPSWTPPGAAIGAVWTVLYAAMGVAAWLVWRRADRMRLVALGLFALQLGLNVLWSLLFFGARSPGAALGEIGVLWLAVAATMIAFWRIDKRAGGLFLPYLAWVTFASYLNFEIWRLNAP